MKPVRSSTLSQSPRAKKYVEEQNAKVLAGNVSFGASMSNSDLDRNISCFKTTGTTPGVALTSFTITHSLGRIPIGFLPISLNVAGAVIHLVSSTTTTITLQCNQATVAYSLLIL